MKIIQSNSLIGLNKICTCYNDVMTMQSFLNMEVKYQYLSVTNKTLHNEFLVANKVKYSTRKFSSLLPQWKHVSLQFPRNLHEIQRKYRSWYITLRAISIFSGCFFIVFLRVSLVEPSSWFTSSWAVFDYLLLK